MGDSIFKNFDADEMADGFSSGTAFGSAPYLYLMIIRSFDLCGRWTRLGNFQTLTKLNNAQFFELHTGVNSLAKIGFDNRKTMVWYETTNSYNFDDLGSDQWALHGKECSPKATITACQIIGLCVLRLIDDAMTIAAEDGVTLAFVESISLAAVRLMDAKDEEAHDSTQFVKQTAIANLQADEKRRRRTRTLSQHAERIAARTWVKNEWESHRDAYDSNKSEFSRIYVRRLMNERGIPVTEKTMRDVWLSDTPIASTPA